MSAVVALQQYQEPVRALRVLVVVDQLVWRHEDHTSLAAGKGMVHGYTGQVAA
jgi:hypothetical protein